MSATAVELIDYARDAILSASRALRGVIRVGGDGVRIGRAAKVRDAVADCRARLEAAMEKLDELKQAIAPAEKT